MNTPFEINSALQDWLALSVRRSIEEFILFTRQNNLNLSQMSLLMKLYYGGPTTLLELRQSLYGSRAAATQMVNKLVELGLLDRSEAPDDRRVKQICLTEQGEGLVRSGIESQQQWLDHLVEDLDPQEKKICAESLSMLNQKALKREEERFVKPA